MPGVQAESYVRSRGSVEELLRLLGRLNVGCSVGMKHQVQAKLLRHLCRLPDHPGHLLPLLRVQTLAAIPRNPARDPVPRFRLRVGKNQERRPQGGKQAAHGADLLDNSFGRGRVAQHYRDK